jgi:PncC family amidohydrolase
MGNVTTTVADRADVRELAARAVALLTERDLTVSCAESCTGGLLSAALTSIPGASAVYVGGCVTYNDEIKHRVLGVRRKSLKLHGAVSPQVAAEMAVGMRERLGTDYALSVTGYAGPDGGDDKDPVGTVYIAVSGKERTTVRRFNASPLRDRAYIRTVAATNAILDALRFLFDV